MWIKEIIIDGFKSYATRTVIKDFDSQFNAITGLNGSGKSNILDAILFCLGLSKEYEILRIKKLQELIYKNAAAGITKAEVTLIFDNTDSANGPTQYAQCEQITISRQITSDYKSKYFINGHAESQKNYKNMLRSVQLNIDNPHFLVAQGRITKIINLKPQELIGMLEETAGTSLYNEKKREAQRTIEKKEEKLKQVQDLIETEIRPQMDKLLKEKNMFLVWRTQETEKVRLKQQVNAYEYYRKHKMVLQKCDEMSQLNDQIHDQKKTIKNQERVLNETQEQYEREAAKKRPAEFDQLVEDFKRGQNQQTKTEKEIEGFKKNKEKVDIELMKNTQEQSRVQGEKERTIRKKEVMTNKLNSMKEEINKKKELFDDTQRQERNGDDEDAKKLLVQEVKENERNIQALDSQRRHQQERLRRNEEDLKEMQKQYENIQKDQNMFQTKIQITKNEMENIQKELEAGLQWENQKVEIKQKINECDETIRELRLRQTQFPVNWTVDLSRMGNYDKKRVFGRVLELIEIKDDTFIKAIELGAGPKLTNIVVDDENTSTYILANRVFQNHNYIIPNSKVNEFRPKEELIRVAEQIASQMGGVCKPALQLINFKKEVARSMGFVFGNFFVASSIEIAQAIAYHQQNTQRCKVVTRDGDIIDPTGTITGGYFAEKNQILVRVQELQSIKRKLEQADQQLQGLNQELKKIDSNINYHNQLRDELQEKKYFHEQLIKKQNSSTTQNIQEQQNKLEADRQGVIENIRLLDTELKEKREILQNLIVAQKQAEQGKSVKQLRQEQIQRLTREIDKLKADIQETKKQIQEFEVQLENHESELETLKTRITEQESKSQDLGSQLTAAQKQLENIMKQNRALQEQKGKMEREHDLNEKTLKRLSDQLNEHRHFLDQYQQELIKYEADLAKNKKDTHEWRQDLHNLETKHEYIRQEKANLTAKHLPEQFSYILDFNFEDASLRLQRLEYEQNKLSKQVNFKVESMTEQVEKEFAQLEEKRKILLQDKSMLTQNMVDLDDKKMLTLEKCFHEVNQHFGQIFSSLLQGATAKIAKIPEKSIEDGLELNVAFGGKWKQSLSELSGGQRSLLALSFILALLKYKPAPFYILDEVDSALDLAHTENIGATIANNFKQSQFILISLKDGMYQNANVLFKVQFLDGISKIDRYALKQKQHQKKQKKMQFE